MEGLAHKELKKEATNFLKKEFGFKQKEIFYEYTLKDKTNRRYKGMQLDVAGINSKQKIGVDCGTIRHLRTPENSKIKLDKLFLFPFILLNYNSNSRHYLRDTKSKYLNFDGRLKKWKDKT